MATTYRTFIRSARNWGEFAKNRKRTVHRNLTFEEARQACADYNNSRMARQVARGTMMEFTAN